MALLDDREDQFKTEDLESDEEVIMNWFDRWEMNELLLVTTGVLPEEQSESEDDEAEGEEGEHCEDKSDNDARSSDSDIDSYNNDGERKIDTMWHYISK